MTTILDSRITLALVGLVGMAMCSAGIGRVAAAGRWTDPLSIVGYALGAAALIVVYDNDSRQTGPFVIIAGDGWRSPNLLPFSTPRCLPRQVS